MFIPMTNYKAFNTLLWGNYAPITFSEEKDQVVTEENKKEIKNYFTINELCASVTAQNLHIDNTPTPEIIENLKELILFLDELREAWGSPIRINSGYRCKKLNTAVKGTSTSVHMKGWAADMYPVNNKMKDFKLFCKEFVKDKKFDQLLLEKSSTAEWVHIGLYNNYGEQRKQIKNMYV